MKGEGEAKAEEKRESGSWSLQSLEQVSDLESAEKVVVCALFRFVEKRFGARSPMAKRPQRGRLNLSYISGLWLIPGLPR